MTGLARTGMDATGRLFLMLEGLTAGMRFPNLLTTRAGRLCGAGRPRGAGRSREGFANLPNLWPEKSLRITYFPRLFGRGLDNLALTFA